MNTEMIRLKCIVIDDEPLAAELLANYISKTPFLELQGVYHNPLTALAAIKNDLYDLVFLDIRMPELSGLKLSELLNPNAKIVFTTAYPAYAVKGFELNAADYLVKPVSFERFLKSCNKVLDIVRPGNIPVAETNIASSLYSPDDVLFVKTDYQIVKIIVSDILYIEGLKEYITIHTPGNKVITLQTMKKMEEVLPKHSFVRVHKSFIVAINKIDSVSRNRINIKNNLIPVGDTYKEPFFSLLNERKMF